MAVTGHFDKPDGVLEQRCALQDFRHLFHTLTNPIADDQQQKPPLSETAVDRVNEGGLGGRVVVEITDMTEQGWRGLLCSLLTDLESRLEIGILGQYGLRRV